eukprot:CAMPEP_0118923292 /NCGR_PEP_ID=MMETSP1169-20130426/1878_1 /TAXON_ID=36882 /ORGANISM="Pyramimonas obovata, Strain CCMP722" /LENGTH=315 /DNA_ID=CAMNT_0006864259 /DNA_START=185 /DNA_END=1128 /DNA_ORIENTATION=+
MNSSKRLKSAICSDMTSASLDSPLSERFSPEYGRYLVASHDVAAGDLLLVDGPAATLAFRRGILCDYCLSMLGDSGFACSGGCGILFCSAQCEEAAAETFHTLDGECDVLRLADSNSTHSSTCGETHKASMPDVPDRFLIRVLAMLAVEASLENVQLSEGETLAACTTAEDGTQKRKTEQTVNDSTNVSLRHALEELDAHEPSHDDPQQSWLLALAHQLHQRTQPIGHRLSEPQVRRLLCALRCNSHTLYASEEEEEAGGVGLYLRASRMNHSCRPNAEFYNVASALHVRAVVDIPAGAEVTVSYVALADDLLTR